MSSIILILGRPANADEPKACFRIFPSLITTVLILIDKKRQICCYWGVIFQDLRKASQLIGNDRTVSGTPFHQIYVSIGTKKGNMNHHGQPEPRSYCHDKFKTEIQNSGETLFSNLWILATDLEEAFASGLAWMHLLVSDY